LASSDTSADASAARQLGLFLTGTEAKEIASHLADGDTLTAALRAVPSGRRAEVRALLEALDASSGRGPMTIVLRAIEGARSAPTTVDPLWTMPGHLAQHGRLTHSVTYLVDSARHSVVCSTFNFQRSSGLWKALQQAAQRPEITMRIYLDTNASDNKQRAWSPTTAEVAKHLHPATVHDAETLKAITNPARRSRERRFGARQVEAPEAVRQDDPCARGIRSGRRPARPHGWRVLRRPGRAQP
jgi:hypothetical protein